MFRPQQLESIANENTVAESQFNKAANYQIFICISETFLFEIAKVVLHFERE